MCSALDLSSFTEAVVKVSDTHYDAAHISKTKHNERRFRVRVCTYKIHIAVIFVRFRSPSIFPNFYTRFQLPELA